MASPAALPDGRLTIVDLTKTKKHVVFSVPNTTTQGPATAAPENVPSQSEGADKGFFSDPNQPTNEDVDLPRIVAVARTILAAVGEDSDRE